MPKPEKPEEPEQFTGFTYLRHGAEREAEAGGGGDPEVPPGQGQGPGGEGPPGQGQTRAVVEEEDAYPDDGTIPEVKDWIGEDLGRARAALDKEQDRPTSRVTLVEYLNDLLED